MTLYFENPVHFTDDGTITTDESWHPQTPLLALASYTQERGGFVTIYDELGEPLSDINFPSHPVSQVTALAWHPERKILATGWENGELKVWFEDKDFQTVIGPHQGPITILQFSEKGSRLVSCDTTGSLVGWKVDVRGEIVTAFHHDLKDNITHVTFRLTIKSHPEFDVEGLAKAAVNGDERALDLLSSWRPKTTARKFRVQDGTDNTCFYVATQTGVVFYINQGGACAEVLNTEGTPVAFILYHPNSDSIVVMMEGLTIGHFRVDFQGHLSELVKLRMSGRAQNMRGHTSQGLTWCGASSLAILTGDLTVRIWDIDSNDNYVLSTRLKNFSSPSKELSRQINEVFISLAYCKLNHTICAGTNGGRIYFWLRKPQRMSKEPADRWDLQNICGVVGTIKQIHWGTQLMRQAMLSVNCVTRVYILKEQIIAACFTEKMWATQRSANEILIETPESRATVDCDLQVVDLCINADYLAVTNGRTITVYSLSRKTAMTAIELGNFQCDNEKLLLHSRDVITLSFNGITVTSPSGSVMGSIPVVANEGEPIGIDVLDDNLTVFTMEGFVKLYDLSQGAPKIISPIKCVNESISDFGEIIHARANRTANIIALTLATSNLVPDGKLYIWNIEDDAMVSHDFQNAENIEEHIDSATSDKLHHVEDSNEISNNLRANFDRICRNRVILNIFWDVDDPRLLCCTAKKVTATQDDALVVEKQKMRKSNQQRLELEDQVLVTMFYDKEFGISIQDIRPTDIESRLLGIATPYIAILHKSSIQRELMSDFSGLENSSKSTKDAVLDFCYNLTFGKMDDAFKAIKLVQSANVWASLARMCVKTRRLDVAGICLGHMGNAMSARAVRIAVNDVTLPIEAKLAVLAIQLGLLDEAEQLYIDCKRYDLLNQLYRQRNKMEAAMDIAQTNDRIHLRNTEFECARALEQNGKSKEAIARYEKGNTLRYDVPRMLMDHPDQLRQYMSKSNDPEMLKWWGQYTESQGDMNAALQIYAKAEDVYSQVRVLCFLGDESRAADLTRSGNDKAAFYHMARHYETSGHIDNAVAFFTRANAYSNAVRLCKENHLDEELWNIGTVAGNREKLECARYFEEIGALEKAIILYHRAGMLHKAFDLAFKSQQYDLLQEIATEVDGNSDPVLVRKCADYFVSNEQYDKAVDIFATGKQYKEAINACLAHEIVLNEELAEKLTPDKDDMDEQSRVSILEGLGEALLTQENYHLATKKFTQAGNKLKAMRAILKSGDTEKIVFFAGVSRQSDIYIMAANYLQTLDWPNEPEILKNIIALYSKGKAFDLLANFYAACANVEIDEFQNYEKAFGAYTEAERALAKITHPNDPVIHQRACGIVQHHLSAVKRFLDAKRVFERGDYDTGITQCKQLLANDNAHDKSLESSVRSGDIYGLMIQMAVKHKHYADAKQYIVDLQQWLVTSTNTPISYYVNKETMDALSKGLGIPQSYFCST